MENGESSVIYVSSRSVTVEFVFYPFCPEIRTTESFSRRMVTNYDLTRQRMTFEPLDSLKTSAL